EGPFVVPPEARNYKSGMTNDKWQMTNLGIGKPDWDAIAKTGDLLAMHDPGIGSNNWVIDGTKSATGKPILANDPHLGIQMPSIWYAIGLHCVLKTKECPYNVIGFSFPAAPGVIIGHNDRIAWGVTTPYADVADLYIEKINPQNPNQYEYQGKWIDLQVIEEPIKVKGVVSETLKIQITRHGPIVTPVLPGVTQPLAFQWVGLRERSRLFEAVLRLDRAQNWDEFRAALKLWDVPSQNFVYADVDGNIGYQLPGNIPIRAKGNGMFPASGSSGDSEWTGYIPFDELPSAYNPPTHFLASANNCIVPSTYKYWISYDCAAPFRQQRIFDLIKAKDTLTLEDIAAMQRDTYSAPEARLKTYLAALTPVGIAQTRALDYVKTWDGYLTMNNVGGTIVAVTLQRAIRNIFGDDLDADLHKAYLSRSDYHQRVLLTLLDQPDNLWWDDRQTPQKETRDAILQKSFAEAVEWLARQYGDAPTEWKWGRLHTATFSHPLGSVQPLNLLFNAGPVGAPGGEATVMRMGFRANVPFAINTASSMRMIVDLSNLASSRHIHTTGQSGQPWHKHYNDQVLLWRDVLYTPMHFDRAAIDRAREGVLVLVP
ncbi:MAG: penicillin acylase family protein, partial [Anaerolineales bacterium]|nr:penicillin acylase family protein [Anaerolineales bacterium]